MTLKQLDYFLVIAETESITRAAEELHVSQPPLSFQLKALEDELGVALFLREKKGLVITSAGRLLQQRAMAIFELINQTIGELRSPDEVPRTSFHIGTINSISNRVLPANIYAFSQTHPNVDIQISEASTTDIIDLLDKHCIDLGIIREPFNTKRYNLLPLFDEALQNARADCFVALASPVFFADVEAEEIDLARLKQLPIILHKRYISMFTTHCRTLGFVPNIICKNNDVMPLLNWAKAGIGVAVLPYTSSILNTDPHLIQKIIVHPTIFSRVFVVWNKDVTPSSEVAAFAALLTHKSVLPP